MKPDVQGVHGQALCLGECFAHLRLIGRQPIGRAQEPSVVRARTSFEPRESVAQHLARPVVLLAALELGVLASGDGNRADLLERNTPPPVLVAQVGLHPPAHDALHEGSEAPTLGIQPLEQALLEEVREERRRPVVHEVGRQPSAEPHRDRMRVAIDERTPGLDARVQPVATLRTLDEAPVRGGPPEVSRGRHALRALVGLRGHAAPSTRRAAILANGRDRRIVAIRWLVSEQTRASVDHGTPPRITTMSKGRTRHRRTAGWVRTRRTTRPDECRRPRHPLPGSRRHPHRSRPGVAEHDSSSRRG